MKVGIQGVKASFHDVAARKFFAGREIAPVECASFKALAESLRTGAAERCLMAIENSIAGSILPNYALLETYGFKIVGEVYLRIEMALMALQGQTVADLKFVRSHPMALLQCEDFLAEHSWIKAIEAADTAESARDIQREQARGHGRHREPVGRRGLWPGAFGRGDRDQQAQLHALSGDRAERGSCS